MGGDGAVSAGANTVVGAISVVVVVLPRRSIGSLFVPAAVAAAAVAAAAVAAAEADRSIKQW